MAVNAWAALEMATVNGAGPGQGYRGHRPGKDGGPDPGGPLRPQSHPLSRPGGGLVFSAHGSNVEMNMARGQVIYEKGEFFTLDLERIRYEVEHYALPKIFPQD